MNKRLSVVAGKRNKLITRVEALASENKSLEEEVASLKQQLTRTEEHYGHKRLLLEKEIKELTSRIAKKYKGLVDDVVVNKSEERGKEKAHLNRDGEAGAARKSKLPDMSDLNTPRVEDKSLGKGRELKSSKLELHLDETGSSRNREK